MKAKDLKIILSVIYNISIYIYYLRYLFLDLFSEVFKLRLGLKKVYAKRVRFSSV